MNGQWIRIYDAFAADNNAVGHFGTIVTPIPKSIKMITFTSVRMLVRYKIEGNSGVKSKKTRVCNSNGKCHCPIARL